MSKSIGTSTLIFVVFIWMTGHAVAQEFEHISPEGLKKSIESRDKTVVIVDTQPKGAYDVGHIKGAINFPWAMDIKSPDKLPKDKTLVIYCDCTHEEDSTDTAKQLRDKWGYTKMELLTGGWSGWQKLGYPTEKTKGK